MRPAAGGDCGPAFSGGRGGMVSVRLYDYAEVFQLAALMAFGCATIGSLLMEDLLRYFGK